MSALSQRLESLDVLRGFDLFLLVFLHPILVSLIGPIDADWYNTFMIQFDHVTWEGFAFWDIIMPLFMFMAGVSMPFAFAKYVNNGQLDRKRLYLRIGKRFVLLWIFGMICQGKLLGLDPSRFAYFSNTLQAIAVGYLFSALIFLNFRPRVQIVIASGLLIAYWLIMTFASGELAGVAYGNGSYLPADNYAEYVDRLVLGSHRDGVWFSEDGSWHFSSDYTYTWIVSSLNFVVTVMTGVFAGLVLKSSRDGWKKVKALFLIGVAMVAAGWLWNLQMPVIKRIWTSSMVLVSSGYCFLLMSLFYYLIDYKKWHKGFMWLKYFGMNSIVAYMLSAMNFRCVGNSLLYGLEQYIGAYYQPLMTLCNGLVIFLILYVLYKSKKFLRV